VGRVVSALPITYRSGDELMFSPRVRPGRKKTVRVTRSLTLHLDEFLQGALDGYAREHDGSASSAVRMAALYWIADRDSGRPAWRAPRFRRPADGDSGGALRVVLDDEIWQTLEGEAQRQNVRTELVAEHAVLYFLADLDSGRVAERLADVADLDD
jgi:predicted DNA-binding ribbon-helix-helix protein